MKEQIIDLLRQATVISSEFQKKYAVLHAVETHHGWKWENKDVPTFTFILASQQIIVFPFSEGDRGAVIEKPLKDNIRGGIYEINSNKYDLDEATEQACLCYLTSLLYALNHLEQP